MPFDYNQASEIPGMEHQSVGDIMGNNIALVGLPYELLNNNIGTGNTWPAIPVNSITATVIPGDPTLAGVLSTVLQWASSIYGDTEPGIIRHSSGYLAQDPTSGIRPGLAIDLPRVMLPPWADRGAR